MSAKTTTAKTTATTTTFEQFQSYGSWKTEQNARAKGYCPVWGVEDWTRIVGFVVNHTPIVDKDGEAVLDKDGNQKIKTRVHLVLGIDEYGVQYTLSLDGGRSQWFLEMAEACGINQENIGLSLVVNGAWTEPRQFTTANGITLTRRICQLDVEPLVNHEDAKFYF